MVRHKPMLGTMLEWESYRDRLSQALAQVSTQQLTTWSDLMFAAYQSDLQVFIIGNGGSGTNAAHFCQDFSKSTMPEDLAGDDGRKRLRTINLTELSAWMLSISNDLGYDQVFEQQLRTLGRAGDLLICLSGSGNSVNVLNAVRFAKRNQIVTIGLTGFDGGKLKQISDHSVHVAIDDMGICESVHLCLFHWVLDDLYARINSTGRYSD